jgi:hypothetical protein
MSNHKIIKVQYNQQHDIFTYMSDDPHVGGDPRNPEIVFRADGKMEFRCDNSDGIKMRFYKDDPANWDPDPPTDEGYHELKDGETCLVFHNNHCHMGSSKLTLKLECKLEDGWTRKDSDPIVINEAPH